MGDEDEGKGGLVGKLLSDLVGPATTAVAKSVGRLLFGRLWEARIVPRARMEAEALDILGDAQTRVETQRRLAHARADIEIAELQASVAERAQLRLEDEAGREQENLEAISWEALNAAQESERRGETWKTDAAPTDDWLNEFSRLARGVSDEDAQVLWGRVLARESQQPGTFGVRTLHRLKEMSPAEADAFRRAALLAFVGLVPAMRDTRYAVVGQLTVDDLLRCGEAGLIQTEPRPVYVERLEPSEPWVFELHGWVFFVEDVPERKELKVNAYPLTQAGAEIWALVEGAAPKEYVDALVAKLKEEGYAKVWAERTETET